MTTEGSTVLEILWLLDKEPDLYENLKTEKGMPKETILVWKEVTIDLGSTGPSEGVGWVEGVLRRRDRGCPVVPKGEDIYPGKCRR